MSSMRVTLHPRVPRVQRLRGGRVSGSDSDLLIVIGEREALVRLGQAASGDGG
jgi:hypothetical protein